MIHIARVTVKKSDGFGEGERRGIVQGRKWLWLKRSHPDTFYGRRVDQIRSVHPHGATHFLLVTSAAVRFFT